MTSFQFFQMCAKRSLNYEMWPFDATKKELRKAQGEKPFAKPNLRTTEDANFAISSCLLLSRNRKNAWEHDAIFVQGQRKKIGIEESAKFLFAFLRFLQCSGGQFGTVGFL